MICKCPSKRTLEFYCQNCKMSICKYCLKADHDNHKNIPISDILNRSRQINLKDVQSFLKTFSKDFQEFKTKINDSYETELSNSLEKLNVMIQSLIKQLEVLQKQLNSTMKMQVLRAQNYFNLIQDSILLMMRDMENPLNLHPNKHPFLIHFFANQKMYYQSTILHNFPIETSANIKLQKIQDILSLPTTVENQIMKLGDKGDIRIDHFLNFQSDLKEVLNRKPILIDEGTFYPCWRKSNVSTSFVLEDETFLVWPGSHNTEKGYFWIHVYNISLMKKEIILKGGESMITIVSTYPN